MLVMDRVCHAAILPSRDDRAERAKQSSQNISKNRSPTAVAEPIGEALAELPFTGDQVVCLGHDQAAWSRPEWPRRVILINTVPSRFQTRLEVDLLLRKAASSRRPSSCSIPEAGIGWRPLQEQRQ